jgi:hypothetical protein
MRNPGSFLPLPLLTMLLAAVGCTGTSSDSAEPSEHVGEAEGEVIIQPLAATLYSNSRYQSPVRGEPGDVLLLAGSNTVGTTQVVYQAIFDTTAPLVHPISVPVTNTASLGAITPTSVDANAVSVVLPMAMTPGQAYALWSTKNGAYFSNGVMINDARPMWVTPGPRVGAAQPSYPYHYTTASRPGIGRTLKVVGRNLQPTAHHQTQVCFTAPGIKCNTPGAVSIIRAAANDNDPTTQVERYVAQVVLPVMPLTNGQATNYAISVSRDGVSWVPVPTLLTILPDPAPINAASSFYPGNYTDAGHLCSPCDGQDDTLCVTRAIHAASAYATANNAPGNVIFKAPTCVNGDEPRWIVGANCNPTNAPGGGGELDDTYFGAPYVACNDYWGIPVPKNVNLIADPAALTQPTIETTQVYGQTLVDSVYPQGQCGAVGTACDPAKSDANLRNPDCCAQGGTGQICMKGGPDAAPVYRCEVPLQDPQRLFGLNGSNVVQGLRFHDTANISYGHVSAPGANPSVDTHPGVYALAVVGNDVTITNNFFDDVYTAVMSYGGQALPDGTYGNADIVFTYNKLGTWTSGVGFSVVEDAVMSNNLFWPGGDAGMLAAGSLGSQRWDVSANTFDGTNSIPKPDGTLPTYSAPYTGFRAGVFFPTFTGQEDVLVASNKLSCIGARPFYDGEAFSTDSNGDNAGFRSAEPVIGAPAPSSTQISLNWPASQNLPANGKPADYKNRWLRIVSGTGLGQARKITAVTNTATTITFTISPPLDVVPSATSSRVTIGNQAWQMNIVDNSIDNSCSLGLDISNTHPASAGVIGVYSTGVDLAIDGNKGIDTAGAYLHAAYFDCTSASNTCVGAYPFYAYQTPQYFVDVRNNSFQGEFGGVGNPKNNYGCGVELTTINGTLINDVLQPDPVLTGFGVSVARNTLASCAVNGFDWQASGNSPIAIVPQQPGDQSLAPGYLDTMIFANTITGAASLGIYNSAAISNGDSFNGVSGQPNYPKGTIVCENNIKSSNFSVLDIDWPATAQGEVSSLIVCSTGCAGNKTPDDVFAPGMVGCGGAVAWAQRASLCAPGYSPCTAAEWDTFRAGASASADYWTDDNLQYLGTGTGNCEAVLSGGNSCGTSPMRVCKPGGNDSYGNHCNWTACGYNVYTNESLGGCLGNTTAGTLCCAN